MSKTLFIELKDKKVNVTLVSMIETWNVIFSNEYKIEIPIDITNETKLNYFDSTWITLMKKDINKTIEFNSINTICLLINTSKLRVYSDIVEIPKENDLKEFKEELRYKFEKQNPNLSLMNLTFNRTIERTNNIVIFYTVEYIEKEILKKINSAFKFENIIINKYVPLNKAINTGLKKMVKNEKKLYYVEIDNNQLIMSFFREGKPVYQKKKIVGLNYVYKNVAKKMEIDIDKAEKLFNSYGSIPPEAIKDQDNRIIYTKQNSETGELMTFDKRDLSTYITESIHGLFSIIFKEIGDEVSKNDISLIFSGEIVKLKGFIDYAKITLNVRSVNVYFKEIIGIKTNTALIQIGGINYVLSKTDEIGRGLYMKNSESEFITKPNKKIQVIKDRIMRFCNYI